MTVLSTTCCARRQATPGRFPLKHTVGAMLAAFAAASAHAALTENLAVSPVAMSLGNAVTADPPGLDSIHFNPAGLA